MKKLRLGKIATVLIVTLIAAFVLSGCSNKEGMQESKGNIEEVTLPDEITVITDIKTDSSGSIIIATTEISDDDNTSTAAIWKLNEDETWEKMFEREFVADASENVLKEAIINIIGDDGIIKEYDRSKADIFEYNFDMHRIDGIENDKITKIFSSLKGYAFGTFCGNNIENVYGRNTAEAKIVNMNFITGEMKYVDELSEVFGLCSYRDSAYVIYQQEYELTEEEEANLTPMSDYPERYARGVIYDMNDGTITESKALDKLAVRFFQKWHKGGPAADNFIPIYYPVTDSKQEAYYLAHNDGIYRMDEDGEELICYEESWSSKKTCLERMTVTPEGDIYLVAYFDDFNEVKLFRIWE